MLDEFGLSKDFYFKLDGLSGHIKMYRVTPLEVKKQEDRTNKETAELTLNSLREEKEY